MAIQLTASELKNLQDLEALIEFGFKQVTSIPVSWYGMRLRKKVLLQMFTAVHSQVQSISILLKTSRTFSVEILLRPVQETLINANYILVGRNNLTVNRFLIGSNHRLIGQINKMIRYNEKNPHHNSGTPLLDMKALKKALIKRENETKGYLRRFPYRIPLKEPSIEERVIEIDKEFVRLRHKSPTVSQQWMYLTQYWLGSEQVHLSARGLLSYATPTKDSLVLLLDGDKDDFDKCIAVTSAMYLEMLYILNSQFKVPSKKQLSTWRTKVMANSRPED